MKRSIWWFLVLAGIAVAPLGRAAESAKDEDVGRASEPVHIALRARWDEIRRREAELAQAERALKDMQDRIRNEIETLKRLKKEQAIQASQIETRIEEARKGIQSKKLQRLVEISSKMPAKAAAAYLSRLEMNTAASILQGMSARKAAQALGAMSPKKAAALSERYLKNDKLDTSRKRGKRRRKPRR